MMQNISLAAISMLLFVINPTAFASGTEFNASAYKAESVDQLYEKGKASYYAKNTSGQRMRYCVRTEDKVEKVSRKSLKSFTGTSEAELTNNLVQCDMPDSTISSLVESDQLTALVYYLNKRYRLELYGS